MCFEQVIFSAFFNYSFRTREYKSSNQPGRPSIGLFSAAADAFNPADYFWGLVRAVGLFTSRKGTPSSRDRYFGQAPTGFPAGGVGDPLMDYESVQKPNGNHVPQQGYAQHQGYMLVQQSYAPPRRG